MLVGIKSNYHVITDQVPVVFSSPVRGMYHYSICMVLCVKPCSIVGNTGTALLCPRKTPASMTLSQINFCHLRCCQ